jgi:hypothetical protein
MKKILKNPEQFFKIIMAILTIYVGVFVYLELTTVRKETAIESDDFSVALEDIPEEVELTLQNDPAFQSAGEVRNVVRDASDNRQRSQDEWTQDAASSTRSGNPEQNARDYERSLYEEFGGAEERERIKTESAERIKSTNNGSTRRINTTTSQSGSQNQYAGSVMVDFSLPGRTAFENNKWHVRNPGYTCGYNSSGIVVVNISVNNSGRVVSKAIDQARSSSATPCMMEQALKYAGISRFNSGSGNVNGYISYRFVSQ